VAAGAYFLYVDETSDLLVECREPSDSGALVGNTNVRLPGC